jgi:glutamate synthase (NADPH/NADH) large chain
VADFILKDWDNQLKNFIKVFPQEYKRALLQQRNEVTSNVKSV